MKAFRFRPSARLQRYLGRELIADPNLAIIEFVKNSYDAGASSVFIAFRLAAGPPTRLIIADDGAGMDETSFERNWMHPGYSEKAANGRRSRRPRSSVQSGRIPVGEKGLGRLAAGRLGERLEVFTRRRVRDLWLHVDFDWAQFEDMTRMMDEVQIPFDYEAAPEENLVSTGTVVVISGLTQQWDGRVRGRPVPGRSRTRLGRLKQDLRLLVRPLEATQQTFVIHLDSDSFLDEDDIGDVTPEAATEESDYIYDFELRQNARGEVTIHRQLRRSERLVKEFGGSARQQLPTARLSDVAQEERRPETLESGAFRGRFLYTPPPAARRAKEIDAVGHSVLLYRDSVLVEPYGLEGDDWVGVSARKAQRQGYALVQPATFSGYVLISRSENPELRDMSNRQGLIENEGSEVFLQHVRAEFLVFERAVFDELSQRWTSLEEKAARQSEESLDLAAIRLRAITHSLGQSLMGLRADVTGVRLLADRPNIPSAARRELAGLADSAERHLEQAGRVLARFRDVPVAARASVKLDDLVSEAVTDVQPLAASLGVTLLVDDIPSRKVFVHEELVREAIEELIRNGVEAPRVAGGGIVRVAHHEENSDDVIDIRDDGMGIPGAGPETDVSSIQSTKGRPGEGLSTVLALVRASRGRVKIASSGSDGTHIEVFLPARLAGLRNK